MGKQCWCGNKDLSMWNDDYALCNKCKTLVDITEKKIETSVKDDGNSLYDSSYWTENMFSVYRNSGLNTFYDIILYHYSERAAYWVDHFLRHIGPPARTLEIGCGMGSLTHWLKNLGFDASATELSPAWRRELAEKLAIPISAYRVSNASEKANSFEAIILMDVFEHVSDPLNEIEAIANELTPNGILMMQLPRYDGTSSYSDLKKKDYGFLRQLLPGEHLFLYSTDAIKKILSLHNFKHIAWYNSIFPGDMFLIASRCPLKEFTKSEIDAYYIRPDSIAAYAALKNYQKLQANNSESISLAAKKTLGIIKRKLKKIVYTLTL